MKKPKLPVPWKWLGDVAILRHSSKRGDRTSVAIENTGNGPEVSITSPSSLVACAPFVVIRAVAELNERNKK